MRVFSSIVLVFLLLISEASAQSTPKRKLIIRGDRNYPPYEFFDEHGNITGYDVELTKALMEKLGYDYDIDLIDWGEATQLLQEKKIDMLMGVSFSLRRLEYFNFSEPHCFIRQCFVYRGKTSIHSLANLFNKEIIVQKNTLAYSMLKESGITNKIIVVDDMKEGFSLLAKGQCDVAICEESMVVYLKEAMSFPTINYVIISDIEPINFCFAMNKDDTELVSIVNKGLDQLKADGTYYLIYDKWLKSNGNEHKIALLKGIIVAGLLLLCLAIIIIAIIRVQVIRATRKLRETNNELELSLKIGQLSAWTYDIKDKAFYPLYGDTPFPKKGMNVSTYMEYIYTDDRGPFLSMISSLSADEKSEDRMIVRHLGGKTADEDKYYETQVIVVQNKSGKAMYLIGAQKDITFEYCYKKNLEISKTKTDYALKAGNLVIWEYDVNTKRISTSNDPSSEYGNKIFSAEKHLRYVHPDDHQIMRGAYHFMDCGTDEDFHIEIRLKFTLKSDIYHSILMTGSPLEKNADGKVIKYVGFRRDITDSKKMIDDLIVLKNRAEQSDRLKSAFLANISHEIRTPLNSIVGFSEVLADCDTNQERRKYVSVIRQNNDMLLNIIDSIVELSRFESDSIDLFPSQFDLCVLFNEIREEFASKIKNPDVQLRCALPKETSIVFLDRDRIEQVISAFLSNAIKFTNTGSIVIGYQRDINGISLYVSDTGIGIDRKDFDRIFERFEKLNTMSQGTGVGLSVAKAIVEAMNGTIKVDSSIGKGSTFSANIPLT